MTPSVSVIIPTYNRAILLERAIRSVLSQTCRDFEIIIVDDASTDNTQEMLNTTFKSEIDKGILICLRNEKNMERSFSRNKGMQLAKGEYIALLDDDDIWLPQFLENAIHFFMEDDEIGCMFSNFIIILEADLKEIKARFNKIILAESDIYRELCIMGELGSPSTAVFKQKIYKSIGGFNERLPYLEDKEFFSRVAMNSKIGFMPIPSVCRYQHIGSYSQPSPEEKENVWKLIETNANKYNFPLNNVLVGQAYINIAWHFLPNILKAKEYLLKALRANRNILFKLETWRLLIRVILGRHLYPLLKRWKRYIRNKEA